jgi:hypothetical protein
MRLIFMLIGTLSILRAAPACGGHGDRSTMLVGTQWGWRST